VAALGAVVGTGANTNKVGEGPHEREAGRPLAGHELVPYSPSTVSIRPQKGLPRRLLIRLQVGSRKLLWVENGAVGCIRHLLPRRHHHPAVVIPRQLLSRVLVDKVLVPNIRRAKREQKVER